MVIDDETPNPLSRDGEHPKYIIRSGSVDKSPFLNNNPQTPLHCTPNKLGGEREQGLNCSPRGSSQNVSFHFYFILVWGDGVPITLKHPLTAVQIRYECEREQGLNCGPRESSQNVSFHF